MENSNEFPFPQADDFEKIVQLLNLKDEEKLRDKEFLCELLGDISGRQAQYYISACQYLGFVSSEKKYTDYGEKIRSLGESQQYIEFAIAIVSKPVFGTAYFTGKMLGEPCSREDIIEIMHDHNVGFEKPEMYKRRAQTVVKWIEWINQKF